MSALGRLEQMTVQLLYLLISKVMTGWSYALQLQLTMTCSNL